MAKKMIVGRLGKDAKEISGANGKFLSFPVAYEGYDKEAKKPVTRWVDVTMNTYGAGLVPKLSKGAPVAIVGLVGERKFTKDGQDRTAETLSVDRLSIGGSMFATFEDGEKTIAAVVGRLGKDAKEVTHEGKTFLGFSVATEVYNKDLQANETLWLDVTVNRYGAGLVPKLVKGTQLAISGLFIPAKDDKGAKVLVNELNFFGNKKKEDETPAPAAEDEGIIGGDADNMPIEDDSIPF